MKPIKTYDQEKASFNLAKFKKGGEMFEVVIDPDIILQYKKDKNTELRNVVMYEKVFSDAKKGFESSPEELEAVFGTNDVKAVIKIILDQGEIQFTQEYREKKRAEKRNRVIDIIVRNAIDPRSGLPHPRVRIESAMDEARVRIDDLKDPEDQVKEVVSALKPILPIKLAIKEIEVKIPAEFGAKSYAVVERFGKVVADNWLSDGSRLCSVEIPAGMQNDFFDALNKLTHGNVESKIVREK